MFKIIASNFLLWTLVISFPNLALASGKSERPNIVLIMADDMGYSDIGCYGGEIKTPNLDQLADQGLRFTNFFNTGRCCPTRASLMTGLYPHQTGMGWMTRVDMKHQGYRGELNRQCVTIAEVLRQCGYACYMSGKWHLTLDAHHDGPKDSWPLGRGFDRFFGTIAGGGNYYRPHSLTLDNQRIQAPKKGFYYTDAISNHAVQFVKEHQQNKPNDPFFLYVAYTAPHWPLHALKEDIAKYQGVYEKGWDVLRKERHDRMKKMGLVDPDWKLSKRDPQVPAWEKVPAEKKKELIRKMVIYAAQVDRMDQGIGRIVETLKQTNRFENTLILFLSDNGGCEEGGIWGFERNPDGVLGEASSFASYGRGWANLSNTLLRLFKHWVHGGGVSTPLIAHWPRGIQEKGRLRTQPGHVINIMATCVDVAETRYPQTYKGHKILPLEGKSLLSAFANKPIEHRAIYWEHEANKAILVGQWKLVSQHPGPWELYNLEADRSETNNLAKKHSKKVEELAEMWDRWAQRCHVYPLDGRGWNQRVQAFEKKGK